MSGDAEILRAVLDIKEDVGGIRSDLRTAMEDIKVHMADDAVAHADFRQRIAKLENERAHGKGFVAGVAAVVSAIVTGLSLLFAGFKVH